MANITLGQLRDLWKNVSDWVTGVATHEPKVTLSGRNAKIQAVVLKNTPLTDEGTYEYATPTDLTGTDVASIALFVASDTPVTVALWGDAGPETPPAAQDGLWAQITTVPFVTNEKALLIPWFRPLTPRYRWAFARRSQSPQSYFYAVELRSPVEYVWGSNLKAWLAYNLAIRDTDRHTNSTDPNHIYPFRRFAWAGAKSPIFIRNLLDQAVTVDIRLSAPPMSAEIGTVQVPAGEAKVVTNQDFAALDVPYEELRLGFSCSVAPTSGTVDVLCDSVMGGLA